MKKTLFILAFLAIIAVTIYIMIKFTFWYFTSVAVAAIILHLTEKPMLLDPDDPRFGY